MPARSGLRHTFFNPNLVFVIGIFLLIYDSGIRKFCENMYETGNTSNIFEGFVFCTNSWLYLMMLGMGFIILIIDTPASDSEDRFLIIRTCRKAWLLPFSHTQLSLHNTYVFKKLSFPLHWSYLYLCILGLCILGMSFAVLKKKDFG